jgi:hypothetical protein
MAKRSIASRRRKAEAKKVSRAKLAAALALEPDPLPPAFSDTQRDDVLREQVARLRWHLSRRLPHSTRERFTELLLKVLVALEPKAGAGPGPAPSRSRRPAVIEPPEPVLLPAAQAGGVAPEATSNVLAPGALASATSKGP